MVVSQGREISGLGKRLGGSARRLRMGREGKGKKYGCHLVKGLQLQLVKCRTFITYMLFFDSILTEYWKYVSR